MTKLLIDMDVSVILWVEFYVGNIWNNSRNNTIDSRKLHFIFIANPNKSNDIHKYNTTILLLTIKLHNIIFWLACSCWFQCHSCLSADRTFLLTHKMLSKTRWTSTNKTSISFPDDDIMKTKSWYQFNKMSTMNYVTKFKFNQSASEITTSQSYSE